MYIQMFDELCVKDHELFCGCSRYKDKVRTCVNT